MKTLHGRIEDYLELGPGARILRRDGFIDLYTIACGIGVLARWSGRGPRAELHASTARKLVKSLRDLGGEPGMEHLADDIHARVWRFEAGLMTRARKELLHG